MEKLKEIIKETGIQCYIVGGYVRDKLLGISNDDIDIVVVGSGIEIAKKYAKATNQQVIVYQKYGTAKVGEYEFVGARKETYQRDSRKPIVEDGTLEDDLGRRDFTINAMAINILSGEIVDLFNGKSDLDSKIIRTPLGNPTSTFSDDPLRMLRAIRFACKLGFTIEPDTFKAIQSEKNRLEIISAERISVELNKILTSSNPKYGIELLKDSGLLQIILPEVACLDTRGDKNERLHKNIFEHTTIVLDNVSKKSDSLWLRWAALLHDIGKIKTRKYDSKTGEWTFHGHEYAGAEMIEPIFRRLRLPLGEELKFVEKLVSMHMRPSMVPTRVMTDSATRRLLFDAGNDMKDLMILCRSDLTTKNEEKRLRILGHFDKLEAMFDDLQKKDYIRLFKPCVNGNDLMTDFGYKPGRKLGEMLSKIKDNILDGTLENTKEEIYKFIKEQE